MTEERTEFTAFGAADAEDGDTRERDPAEAFSALAHPIRVDTLRELVAHRRETGEATIGFADLRRRVGLRDSGQFRYHLDELRDGFVERVEGGYRPTHAGSRVVAAVYAGTYTDDVSLGPAEVGEDCPFCGAPAVAVYRDGACAVACAEGGAGAVEAADLAALDGDGHPLFRWAVPPNAAADAPLPAVVERAELLALQAVERSLSGMCSQCHGDVGTDVVVEDGDARFRSVCEACGVRIDGPLAFPLLADAGVAAACRRHGHAADDCHLWELPLVGEGVETTVLPAGAEARVEVTAPLGDGRLRATVDDRGRALAVDPPGDPPSRE